MRENWYLTNISNGSIALGDLPNLPTVDPGNTVDLLAHHDKTEISLSSSLAAALDVGVFSLDKQLDGVSNIVTSTPASDSVVTVEKDELTSSGGGGEGYVPYTGADDDVDLGTQDLAAANINATVGNITTVNSTDVNSTNISSDSITSTGNISGNNISASGDISSINANITGDVNANNASLTGNLSTPEIVDLDYIDFDTTASPVQQEGRLHWNGDDKTLEIDTEVTGVKLQIGQESLLRCTNKTGATIPNGSVVYVNDAQGNRPTIALANNDALTTSTVIGVATVDIAHNATSYIATFGLVRNLNTDACSEGDILWLSDTDGEWTNVRPDAPNFNVVVGICVLSHLTQGIILVNVDIVPRLEGLSDVYIDSAELQDRQVVAWNSTNSRFENTSFSEVSASNVTTQTATYTADYGDFVLMNNSTNVEVDLPTAVGHAGESIIVKKISNNAFTVTIDGNGTEVVDGELTQIIDTQYDSVTLISDDSNWFIT